MGIYETQSDGRPQLRAHPGNTLSSSPVSDIDAFPGDHEIGALGIVVSNGNMLAFHELHDGLVSHVYGDDRRLLGGLMAKALKIVRDSLRGGQP